MGEQGRGAGTIEQTPRGYMGIWENIPFVRRAQSHGGCLTADPESPHLIRPLETSLPHASDFYGAYITPPQCGHGAANEAWIGASPHCTHEVPAHLACSTQPRSGGHPAPLHSSPAWLRGSLSPLSLGRGADGGIPHFFRLTSVLCISPAVSALFHIRVKYGQTSLPC